MLRFPRSHHLKVFISLVACATAQYSLNFEHANEKSSLSADDMIQCALCDYSWVVASNVTTPVRGDSKCRDNPDESHFRQFQKEGSYQLSDGSSIKVLSVSCISEKPFSILVANKMLNSSIQRYRNNLLYRWTRTAANIWHWIWCVWSKILSSLWKYEFLWLRRRNWIQRRRNDLWWKSCRVRRSEYLVIWGDNYWIR